MPEASCRWNLIINIFHYAMNPKRISTTFLTLLIWIVAVSQTSGQWRPDILGDGYEMRHVSQPDDYSGKVISTIIRKLALDSLHNLKGVLYVHGFNDYFFQSEMGDKFVEHGYDFYAVDLRKYGRSILPGQKKFELRNINEYFADIDSAVAVMKATGLREIILMGHSTGGLTVSCYLNDKRPEIIKGLILNSPFLDWNLGGMEKFVWAVSALGKVFPNMKISQGKSTAYSESLLKAHHGEWGYNTDWKLEQSPDVTAGWVRAINLAQKSLRDGKADIRIPILLMYSSNSVDGDGWEEKFNHGDAVLDVKDIKKYGAELGPDVTCVKVMEGLHDLVLSRPEVRAPLYRYIFSWLKREHL